MQHHIFSVTELNETLNEILSQQSITVQGEVSDFKISQNKFVYFDLKDDRSKISCFLMKFQLKTEISDGMEIRLTGRPGIWVPGGRLTFRVDQIELIGEGALRKQFELTKKKLEALGLFDPANKKSLPRFPQNIGIISSETAAAFTDVLRILNNRWGGLHIALRPVRVQGNDAIPEIVSAVRFFNEQYPRDLLIITRGGGSLEDLQAFNSEEVCHAVFASKIPTIAAIGHERDETLVEYVADRRASTPSNAAEFAVPDKHETEKSLQISNKHMKELLLGRIDQAQAKISESHKFLAYRIEKSFQNAADKLSSLQKLLSLHTPEQKLSGLKTLLEEKKRQISSRFFLKLDSCKDQLEHEIRLLGSYDPEKPLARGYSLTMNRGGKLVRSLSDLSAGDEIITKFQDGKAISVVQTAIPE